MSIEIINNSKNDPLPISVIVPLSEHRKGFFNDFTLPMIKSNNVAEIVINDDEGTAAQKRNAGFQKSTQPFIYCVDDDCLLPSRHLEKLHQTLIDNPDKGYAYTGYIGIVTNPVNHPLQHNFVLRTQPFNVETLQKNNFISTMALVRREHFLGFDETLSTLEDWDLWLSLLDKGVTGIAVQNNEFIAFFLDKGTSSAVNTRKNQINNVVTIKKKHNLK
jgi:hypothetical protein